ncbi:MAG: hypothetical protein Cons2KO_29340 [Congregibacter sp.]
MSQNTTSKSLPKDKFLTIAVNLLNNALLESTRTEAKKLFRELEEGKTVPITTLEMEDKSRVRVDLALNHTLYRGKFNFGNFRTGLKLLLANCVEALKKPDELKTFHSEHDANSVLFGVLAITVEDEQPSLLVLGAESGGGEPRIKLQLTYLDSVQFESNIDPAELAEDGDQPTVA